MLCMFSKYNRVVNEGLEKVIEDRSILWLAFLKTWVRTGVASVTDKEFRRRHRRKLYIYQYQSLWHSAMEQMNGNVHLFAEY